MTTQVEFVDRYTGTPHEGRPWMRSCFGDCEAMGWVPVQDPDYPTEITHERTAEEAESDRALVAIAKAAGQEPDSIGYYFVRCPDCGGTGTVSWLRGLSRLPRLLRQHWRLALHGGPEDDRPFVWRFAARNVGRELWRGLTWQRPEALK